MLPTRQRAGEDDRHWPFATLLCDATIRPESEAERTRRQLAGFETSKIPAAVNFRGPSVARRGLAQWGHYFGVHGAWRPEAPRELFLLSGNVVPFFFPSSVLILSTFTQASSFICRNTGERSIIGIWKIEGRQERPPARAHLGRGVPNARRSWAGTRFHPRDCGVLIHPAGSSLRDVLKVDGYIFATLVKESDGHGTRHEGQFDSLP
jgi:hypothetical protein